MLANISGETLTQSPVTWRLSGQGVMTSDLQESFLVWSHVYCGQYSIRFLLKITHFWQHKGNVGQLESCIMQDDRWGPSLVMFWYSFAWKSCQVMLRSQKIWLHLSVGSSRSGIPACGTEGPGFEPRFGSPRIFKIDLHQQKLSSLSIACDIKL